MPKVTSGGPSNAWEAQEQGAADAELPPPPPASAPKAEHVEYAAAVLNVPADEAEAMRKADLVELAQAAVTPPQPAPAAPAAAPAAPAVPAASVPAESPSAPQPGM